MIKKKLTTLVLFFVGLALGLHLQSSTVYANYLNNQVTETDIEEVCVAIGCPYNSNSVASRTTALNKLLVDKDVNLANIVFYTDLTSLYAIIQNGSAGSDELPILCIYQQNNVFTVRQHQGFIYSGDKIIGVKPATYITKYLLSQSGGTYKESGGNIREYGYLSYERGIVNCPKQLIATWGYNAVATWSGDNYVGYRNLRPYKELSNWETVVPTSTPTPTPTQAQSGSVDLSETNQKIDDVKNEVQTQGQSVVNTLSGNHEELMNTITEVPSSGDFQNFSSGDFLNSLNLDRMESPNDSFWSTMINGFSTALTCTQLTSININFLGKNYSLPVVNPNYPEELSSFLSIISVALPVLTTVVFWRRIYITVSSGNALEVAHMFSGYDWSNFF